MKEIIKERIIANYDNYSATELKVAKYVVDHYQEIWTYSSGELARTVGVSDATVVRFAKSLGYKGFLQLRGELKSEGNNHRSPYYIAKSMSTEIDDQVISEYAESMQSDIRELFSRLELNKLEAMATKILNAETVYIYGVGSDRVVSEFLGSYFPIMGIKTVLVMQEGLGLRERVINMSDKDILMMSSFPTVQSDEFWLADYAKECGADIYLLTDSELTAKGLGIDKFFITRRSTDAFYNSSVLSMCFCDILLLKIREMDQKRVDAFLYKYDEMCDDL